MGLDRLGGYVGTTFVLRSTRVLTGVLKRFLVSLFNWDGH